MINNILETGVNTGVAIFLTILLIVIAPVAIFFLYRSVKKEKAKFLEVKNGVSTLDKETFNDIIKGKMKYATSGTHINLFSILINDAKTIRESFGDQQYSNAIEQLLLRLSKIFSQSCKVCKYEYDQIIILTTDKLDEKGLEELGKFLVNECKKPISLVADFKVEFDVNIGISYYSEMTNTFEELMQSLELALVISKRSGVNGYILYNLELTNRESEEYKYYQEIKTAIEYNEFTLYYQPIKDIEKNETYGYESLLRWNHKTLGVLTPDKFLNIMEQSGDINWVGIWAYEELLLQYQNWKTRFPTKSFVLTMNLSPKQLMYPKLIEDMRRIIKKYNVDPANIIMEIIEFAYFDKMQIVKDNIDKLKQCGFKIAIDKYGPEMNTLSLLDKINVDIIKLDRTFLIDAVENMLTKGIVSTLIEYAKNKNIIIIAEGVENMENVEFLKSVGIHYAQGYFYGRPTSPREYEADFNKNAKS